MAELSSRHQEAQELFRAGLFLAERSEAPAWIAYAKLDLARSLYAQGHSRGEAERLFEAAMSTGERLGLRRLIVRGQTLSRGKRTYPRSSGWPDGLSSREVDVLRCVGQGLSNRAIGERLLISENTAANHVRSILQKTGCSNRAEATAYAARHNLLTIR